MKKTTNVPKGYYQTAPWKKFIKKLLDPDTTQCELCGSPRWKIMKTGEKRIAHRFSIHHKNYRHLGHETRDDVMVICSRCHNICHDILRIKSDSEAIVAIQAVVRSYFEYDHIHD